MWMHHEKSNSSTRDSVYRASRTHQWMYTQENNEENNSGGMTGTTVTMTAQEYYDDMTLDTDRTTFMTMSFALLEDGDTLIIQDTINETTYDADNDATMVKFTWINGSFHGSLSIPFEANITSTYQAGDDVQITTTITHVTFTHQEINYDLEIFEEQWESADYYINNVGSTLQGLKPMPTTIIQKT